MHDEDLNSFASPSDMMMTPHCYPQPSSLMHGGYPSGPQPCVHDFQYQCQGPQLHGYTPHDLQVLARIRNRPVVCFCHRESCHQLLILYFNFFFNIDIRPQIWKKFANIRSVQLIYLELVKYLLRMLDMTMNW